MLLFSLSIFLSAFLLFQIQPMIGRFILPWFGGTPAVWSTAMLFFQLLLTGGYAYAAWLVKRRRQGWIHIALLTLTAAVLAVLALGWPSPITPSADLRPMDVSFPIPRIFFLLTISVGLPYFMLAANGPLMQAWFSRFFPERSYARLYALSNIGSLLGLLAYPVLIEPSLTLFHQGWVWTGGFMVFAAMAGVLSYRIRMNDQLAPPTDQTDRPSGAMRIFWIILSGTASLFLLSVTNQISQEVAVIPFLWIVPLAVYLLSFILAFSDSRWYDRRLYALLFSLASLLTLWSLNTSDTLNVIIQIAVYNLLLFLACMICHGELYRLRPHADHLTGFYLMVSLGGAAGGLFVNLVAPVIFTGYWEFYLGWLLVIVLLVVMLLPRWSTNTIFHSKTMLVAFLVSIVILAYGLGNYQNALYVKRNFYGVIRVREFQENDLAMIHGMTIHGIQFFDDRKLPTTYFVKESGVGILLLNHPLRGKNMKVGVLGLGVGTLAAYAQPGDSYRFYEINPVVVDLAQGQGGYFTFLKDSQAQVAIVEGDARISLERELAAGQAQHFDVLVLDTFSSDSIPVHLVTREAFALYLQHLAPDGVIAAHISNRHLDLRPVFWQLSREFGLAIVQINRPASLGDRGFPSEWILLAHDPALLNIQAIQSHAISFDGYGTTIRLWTDDYSNLFQILK